VLKIIWNLAILQQKPINKTLPSNYFKTILFFKIPSTAMNCPVHKFIQLTGWPQMEVTDRELACQWTVNCLENNGCNGNDTICYKLLCGQGALILDWWTLRLLTCGLINLPKCLTVNLEYIIALNLIFNKLRLATWLIHKLLVQVNISFSKPFNYKSKFNDT